MLVLPADKRTWSVGTEIPKTCSSSLTKLVFVSKSTVACSHFKRYRSLRSSTTVLQWQIQSVVIKYMHLVLISVVGICLKKKKKPLSSTGVQILVLSLTMSCGFWSVAADLSCVCYTWLGLFWSQSRKMNSAGKISARTLMLLYRMSLFILEPPPHSGSGLSILQSEPTHWKTFMHFYASIYFRTLGPMKTSTT